MKKVTLLLLAILLFCTCNDDDDNGSSETIYKQRMRDFVIGISNYARSVHPGFIVIPQNGVELVTTTAEEDGPVYSSYLDAIDGHGQEDLFYGYTKDDKRTPPDETAYLRAFLDISKSMGNTILVTDYCSTHSNMDESYSLNHDAGYVSFAASERELNVIPGYPASIYSENDNVITALSQAKNFLYLINPESFSSKQHFINAITSTNYDLLIMDLFSNENVEFTSDEVNQLKSKDNGGQRLVICYMSIGEAEDYRYYWQSAWSSSWPSWIEEENPDWEGNYIVKYWESQWQEILFGNDDSYLKKIIDAGYDGVYLDIIDAFEYFE